MMKKVLCALLLLAWPAVAGAKTLAPSTSYTPATDSVYTAVDNLRTEVVDLFEELVTLYTLQAATTCPASGNDTNDICFDYDNVILQYWDGAAWQTLASPTGYSSGLTLGNAVMGYSENCTLERDADTDDVMINATAIAPCTLENQGELLQVASKIVLDFSAATPSTRYYIRPVRTGTTTAFTLARDTALNGTDNYVGTVLLDASRFPIMVTSYKEYAAQRTQNLLELVHVSRQAAVAVAATYGTVLYDTEHWDPGNAFNTATGRWTPARRGMYEVQAASNVTWSSGNHCLAIYQNGSAVTTFCAPTDTIATPKIYLYFNGSTDYLTVSTKITGTSNTVAAGGNFMNALWGRWIGTRY